MTDAETEGTNMSDDITTCDGCINGCQECYPFRCYDCGSKTGQDDRDLSRCGFCAEDMRKLKARAEREEMTMAKTISTENIQAANESIAVAVGKAIISALDQRAEIDVERGDNMDDAEYSELRAYLSRRGITLREGVAYSE